MTLGDGYHDVPRGKVAMVVTHLEIYAPQLRGAALPNGLSFGELPRDLDTYRDLFRRVGANWLWFARLALPDADLEKILHDPQVHLFSLFKNGTPEALLELNFAETGQCELAYFGLTSALIGSGAGAYLMDRAQERAFAQGISRLHVHTCTIDSPQALGFYIRSGFVPYRQQIEIDDDPRLSGMLPKDAAPQVPMLD